MGGSAPAARFDNAWWRWGAVCLTGAAVAFVQSLHPLWPVAWVAPAPALAAILRTRSKREIVAMALVAGLLGQASMAVYYVDSAVHIHLSPLVVALLVAVFTLPGAAPLTVMLLLWRLCAGGLSRWLLPLMFPAIAAAVDLAFASISPNGTLGSWAYSQMSAAPVIQVAAIGGAPAVVFLVSLASSTLAVALLYGRHIERPRLAYGLPAALLLAGLGFGFVRLATAPAARTIPVVMAATDVRDADPGAETAYLAAVQGLVDAGGGVVVLPEMIVRLDGAAIEGARAGFSNWARAHHAALVVGVDIGAGEVRESRAWVFDGAGVQRADYLKQHLVPLLDRDYGAGRDASIVTLDGARLGVAICKDLDFPGLARTYARDGAKALVVPALDFGLDGELHARMAVLRGVEQGLGIIRAAADGVMTVSDPYGRMIAERPSGGRGAVATLSVTAPLGSASTVYSALGDAFGWACMAATALALALSVFRSRQTRRGYGRLMITAMQ